MNVCRAMALAFLLCLLPIASTAQSAKADQKSSATSRPPSEDVKARIAAESAGLPPDRLSAQERIRKHHDSRQPPVAVMEKMTTPQLVEEITSTGLVITMLMASSPKEGLGYFANSHHGVDILLKREDLLTSILNEYTRLSKTIGDPPRGTLAEQGKITFQFSVLETLLASDQAIAQASPAQKREVVSKILAARQAMQQYDAKQSEPRYGRATDEYSSYAIAAYLASLNYKPLIDWQNSMSGDIPWQTRRPSMFEINHVFNFAKDFLRTTAFRAR